MAKKGTGTLTISLDEKTYRKLEQKLMEMEDIEAKTTIKEALKKGMEVVLQEGKHSLAVKNKVVSGHLSSSWKKSQPVVRKLGSDKSSFIKGGFTKKGSHAHLVDRGTKVRKTKSGANRGSISKGNPNHGSLFWTEAVHAKAEEAIGVLYNAIVTEITRILNK